MTCECCCYIVDYKFKGKLFTYFFSFWASYWNKGSRCNKTGSPLTVEEPGERNLANNLFNDAAKWKKPRDNFTVFVEYLILCFYSRSDIAHTYTFLYQMKYVLFVTHFLNVPGLYLIYKGTQRTQ